MRVATIGERPLTLGWIIALIVLVLAIIFVAIGRLDIIPGGLIALLAVSRLL